MSANFQSMDIKTFRAKTVQEALAQVRRELGPQAAVLHTREVKSRSLFRLSANRLIEVVASAGVHVPSRLPRRLQRDTATLEQAALPTPIARPAVPAFPRMATKEPAGVDLLDHLNQLASKVDQLCR